MSKAGKAIGTVAHGINKHGLERKFSARGKTLLAATIVVYLAGAHMRAGEAGDNLRSDLKDKAAPAAASVISGTAEFLGIDNLSLPHLPDLNISTSGNSSGDSSVGSLAVHVSGVKCHNGTYPLDRGSLGAYDDAGLTVVEASIALGNHPEVQDAAGRGVQTVQVICD